MSKPRKPTPNQRAWELEVKRLTRIADKANKRGIKVPQGFIPPKPKRITKKALNLIQAKTYKDIFKPEKPTTKPPKPDPIKAHRKHTDDFPVPRKHGDDYIPHPRSRKEPERKERYRPTPLDREYRKEINRIRATLKRAKDRGYNVPDISQIANPRARYVSADEVERLRSIKGDALYTLISYTQDGKLITGLDRLKQERHNAGVKAWITRQMTKVHTSTRDYTTETQKLEAQAISMGDQIVQMVYSEIGKWEQGDGNAMWTDTFRNLKREHKNTLKQIFDDAIAEHGSQAIAMRLYNTADNIKQYLFPVLYGSDQNDVDFALTRLATLLNDGKLSLAMSEALSDDGYYDNPYARGDGTRSHLYEDEY